MIDILPILADLVAKYPWIIAILTVIGGLRVFLKPFLAFLYTVLPPSGDAALGKLEQSKAWKAFLFVLDWLASIKIPTK